MLKCSSKNNEAALRHTLTHADTLLTLAEIVCKPSKMQIVEIFCQLEPSVHASVKLILWKKGFCSDPAPPPTAHLRLFFPSVLHSSSFLSHSSWEMTTRKVRPCGSMCRTELRASLFTLTNTGMAFFKKEKLKTIKNSLWKN